MPSVRPLWVLGGVLLSSALALGCGPPDPYWVTDPTLRGAYPPAGTGPAGGGRSGVGSPPELHEPEPSGASGNVMAQQLPHGQSPGPAVGVRVSAEPLPAPSAAPSPASAAIPGRGATPPSAPKPHSAGGLSNLDYKRPLPPMSKKAPATRYGNLSRAACRKALAARKIPFKRAKKAVNGIANAIRISGHLNGVRIVSAPAPSPFGLLDCRLALALDDMTRVVAPRGIKMLFIGSMYRKGAKISHNRKKSQHGYGLAMDILSMRHTDGRLLKVERDWHAGIGDRSCGPSAVMHKPSSSSVLLRNVMCDLARAQIFHVMLTPGSNRAHHDHFHFDIKRGAKYQWVR